MSNGETQSHASSIGVISVFIDANVWDFLFDRRLDLAVELPYGEFRVCLTREAEFEMPLMPPEKRAFAEEALRRYRAPTDVYFGFYDKSLPAHEQRVAGFDQGRFASPEEIAFLAQQTIPSGAKRRPTGLFKNEADRSIAARSMARSFPTVVLSLDQKKGPIRHASEQGGTVVFLNDFDTSGLSLRDFILNACPQLAQSGG